MKYSSIRSLAFAGIIAISVNVTSCKNKSKSKTTETINVDSNNAVNTAPVIVQNDTELEKGVRDATKDYPGVQATVDTGVVTLRGTLERSRLTNLMQTLHGLNPRNIKNELTLK